MSNLQTKKCSKCHAFLPVAEFTKKKKTCNGCVRRYDRQRYWIRNNKQAPTHVKVVDLEGEIWKDIDGYEGYFQISSHGRVKSLDRNVVLSYRKEKFCPETLYRLILGTTKYYQVTLSKNNNRKSFKVHRLVAKAFVLNSDNKPVINHIDANKLNNHYTNLEWCTHKENNEHARKLNLVHCEGKPLQRPLIVEKDGVAKRFESQKAAAKYYGLTARTIRSRLYGKTKNYGGLYARFAA